MKTLRYSFILILLGLGLNQVFADPSTPPAKKSKGKSSVLDNLKLVEGDETGNEEKSLKSELLVSNAEHNAIVQLQKLLKKYKGSALEPELQFRLAELYMRKSKTDRFFEIHRESETVVHLAPRVTKEAASRQSVQLAVNSYTVIQNKYPDFAQMDLVLFNHAFARQILGDDKVADGLYSDLINKYPKSPLAPDAHLAVGEIDFDHGNFQAALEHFNAIRKYPKSRVYPYGLYKAAWTYYNMRDAGKGLQKLEEVVAYGRYVAKNKIEARLDLRKEALNDMTLFFEDVYAAKDAYNYFRDQAGDMEVGPILLKMSSLYERHSRYADQQVVLNEFVIQLPDSPLLPKVHTDLVTAYDHFHKKDEAVARLEILAKLCEGDSHWVHNSAKTEPERKKVAGDCMAMLNDSALKLAKKWLKAWKKLPSDTTYADASEKAFEIYLRTPGAGDEYAQSRYAYAELLFSRHKSSEYAFVSHLNASGTVTHDALYGALISLEKAAGDKWSNDDEKAFHALAEEYLAKNPNGQYRLDIEYKMALLAYEKERYDEAGPRFLRLGRQFPKEEKGQKSQDLYLDILNLKKDYAGIRNYTQELIKLNSDASRGQKMHKLYEQAYFLEVQGLEEKGRLKEALQGYVSFAQQNPNSEFSEKAMWNAMLLAFKQGDPWTGAKMAEEFATKYPTSAQSVNALLRAAQTFEQMAQLSEAARVLEKLAARDAKAARRWNELAADFHALSGETMAARKLYEDLEHGADNAQKLTLIKKREALEHNYGTEQSHASVVKTMVDQNIQPQAGQAKVDAVEAIYNKGHMTEAFNEARKYLGSSLISNSDKAHLRLITAKVLEQEFLKSSVRAHAERVGQVLAIKTEKLQKAQEAFQATIKFGDPRVSIEAFEHLYSCYTHYVKALKEMPVPVGLSEADAQAFHGELDDLVVPLEEKSVDTLAQAVSFARKQQYLDDTVMRLSSLLDTVNQQKSVHMAPELQKPEMVLPLLAGVNP
jgi:TolA-binding protein